MCVCVCVCVFFLSLISLQTRHFLLELWLTTLLRSWLRGEIISSFLWIDIWDQRSKLVQNSSSSAQIYHWMEFPVTRVNQDYWHSLIQSSLDKTEPDSYLTCMTSGHWPRSTLQYQTLQGKLKKLTRVLRTLFSKIRSTVQIVLGRPHSTSVDIQHKQLLDIHKYTQRSYNLLFPPRYPDIERLADIFEVITVNLTRMFVQWFWYRMETQGSNNLGENPFLSQGITSIGENTSTRRSDGDGVWRWKILLLGIINMKNISHSYKCFLLQAIASAAWGFVQASRETDEEQERAWCQVNLNQLFLQF